MWLPVCLLFILLAGYAGLMLTYRRWFIQIKPFELGSGKPSTRFSVIIPARNEAAQIEACLTSVLTQQYPTHLFEVIVINDFSEDDTEAIIRRLQQQFNNLRLLNLHEILNGKPLNSYKKKAIEKAIGQANGDWIVTTDADCFVYPQWLSTYAAFIRQQQPQFIAAPVQFINTGSFLSVFQCLDFLSMQGITAASVHHNFHSMCNGANLAYSRAAFQQVGGFSGIDNIASGDDMLLMHKMYEQYPQGIRYMLSEAAITRTLPMPTWKTFINQRIRWASKSTAYSDKRIIWVLALVYGLNAGLVVLPVFAIWNPAVMVWWLAALLLKTGFELSFMLPVARFYRQSHLLWWFLPMQLFHIGYIVVAGWLGKFGTYQWKGRAVK